jgi:hypothetical protein
MAQVVGYWENNVIYTEGPFVITKPLGNGWRIEVELKGHHCPVLPDLSICRLQETFGLRGKVADKDRIAFVCDQLNSMVAKTQIVLRGNCWVYPS